MKRFKFRGASASPASSAGISLLETLLSVGLLGVLSVAFIGLMEGWARTEKASATASYMQVVADAAANLVRNYHDFDLVYRQVKASGGVLQIPVLGVPSLPNTPFTLENGGPPGEPNPVEGSPIINPAFMATNPLKQDISVVISIADPAASSEKAALNILVASQSTEMDSIIREAASNIGGNAGFISAVLPTQAGLCLSVGCTQTVRGNFGDWSINLNDFAGTAWGTHVLANPPTIADGAYLVVLKHVSGNEAAGDYLYRTAQVDNPGLNRMYGSFNLARNSLVGADNVFVNGDVHANDYVDAQGSAFFGDNLSTTDLVVDTDIAAGELRMLRPYKTDPRLDETGASSPLIHEDPTSVQTIVFGGTLDASSLSVKNLLSAQTSDFASITSGKIKAESIVTPTLTLQPGAGLYAGSVAAGGINVSGKFYGNNVYTDTLAGTGTMTVDSNAQIQGSLAVSGDMTTHDVSVESLSIDHLTQCLDGCVR